MILRVWPFDVAGPSPTTQPSQANEHSTNTDTGTSRSMGPTELTPHRSWHLELRFSEEIEATCLSTRYTEYNTHRDSAVAPLRQQDH